MNLGVISFNLLLNKFEVTTNQIKHNVVQSTFKKIMLN